jgi:hypothetical protein
LRGNLKSEFTLVSTGCEHTISCNWIETWNSNRNLHYVHKYWNTLMYIHWNDSNPNFSGTICCNKSKQTCNEKCTLNYRQDDQMSLRKSRPKCSPTHFCPNYCNALIWGKETKKCCLLL